MSMSKPISRTHLGTISGKAIRQWEGFAPLGRHLADTDIQERGEAVQGREKLAGSFVFDTLFSCKNKEKKVLIT